MIVWNGREVAPQKIKRIQLGNKIVYIRRSKMFGEAEFEFDMEALANGVSTVPLDSDFGFLIQIASSPETELHVVASDISETDLVTEFEIEPELYVELTAPMIYDEPLVFVLEPEVLVPETAVCEMDETIPIIFEAEANAPETVKTEQEEIIGFDVDISPEANAADSALAEKEFEVFRLEAEAEIKAAETALLSENPQIGFEIDSEIEAADSVLIDEPFVLAVDIEAELWIKPGEWTNPVLKNNVLGISQALSTEKSGNILKIN